MVRVHLDPPSPNGALAQLGERLICIQEVIGSIPIGSTSSRRTPEMKTRTLRLSGRELAGSARFFDIVNGFFNRCRNAWLPIFGLSGSFGDQESTHCKIWLRLSSAPIPTRRYAGLSLMVWILKREVRAFGGCLGTYRR